MNSNIQVDKLCLYVENNEVTFQFCGELIGVSNETEKNNKRKLLSFFRKAKCIEIYDKNNSFVEEGWPELVDCSTDGDVLFLLDGIGVLIRVPKKEAVKNNLIENNV